MFTLLKLLVIVVLVVAAATVLFGVVSFLAGAVWFVIKLLILAAVIYAIFRFLVRR